MNTDMKEGDFFAYERPDALWGYFQLLRIEDESIHGRKSCLIMTFGDPSAVLFTGTPKEVATLSRWKRTFFTVYKDKVIEIDPIYIGHADVTDDQLETLKLPPKIPPFDSVDFFWLDYIKPK